MNDESESTPKPVYTCLTKDQHAAKQQADHLLAEADQIMRDARYRADTLRRHAAQLLDQAGHVLDGVIEEARKLQNPPVEPK